jgi:hypothetical protein
MAATAAVVDLTGVSEGGNFRPKRRPEGDYKAKIVKADDHQPKDSAKPKGWVLTIQVDGDARSTYPYYLSPEKKQAWKIGSICRAVGLKVPAGRMKFDPNKLVNRSLGIELGDDEYNDRVKSAIQDVFPVSEIQANADDESAGDIDEVEDDQYTEDDEVDVPEDDEEPEEEEEEEEPEPTPPPKKRVVRRKPAPEPEPEPQDEEEEDDEEEPPPPPAPRKRAAAPAKRTVRKAPPPPVEDDLDDDLDEIDTDDLDD